MLKTDKSAHFSSEEAKKAAARAAQYFRELFPNLASKFQLEEIFFHQKPKPNWGFTFGYRTEDLPFTQYKVVYVDAKTYDLVGIKMRD